MNYQKLYENIIEYRKANKLDEYTEIHHIIPKSFGGSDTIENLVELSAREHFICHVLLVKMQKRNTDNFYKMCLALSMMKNSSSNQVRYFNSRIYKHLRENHSISMSYFQRGDRNSMFGRKWYTNMDTGESICCKDDMTKISNKFMVGRFMSEESYKNKITRKSSNRREIFLNNIREKSLEESRLLFKQFMSSGCESLSEFCRMGFYNKSQANLTMRFRKLPEYRQLSKQGKILKRDLPQ